MDKRKYYLDEIKIPGIEPSDEWKEYAELEREGKATSEDARRLLHEVYHMKDDGVVLSSESSLQRNYFDDVPA